MSNIKQIELPNGAIYDIIDATAIHPSDVDSSLDYTSTNPVKNGVVTSSLGQCISYDVFLNAFTFENMGDEVSSMPNTWASLSTQNWFLRLITKPIKVTYSGSFICQGMIIFPQSIAYPQCKIILGSSQMIQGIYASGVEGSWEFYNNAWSLGGVASVVNSTPFLKMDMGTGEIVLQNFQGTYTTVSSLLTSSEFQEARLHPIWLYYDDPDAIACMSNFSANDVGAVIITLFDDMEMDGELVKNIIGLLIYENEEEAFFLSFMQYSSSALYDWTSSKLEEKMETYVISGISATTAVGTNGVSWTMSASDIEALKEFMSTNPQRKAVNLQGVVGGPLKVGTINTIVNLMCFDNTTLVALSGYELMTGVIGSNILKAAVQGTNVDPFLGFGMTAGTFVFAFPNSVTPTPQDATVYLYFFPPSKTKEEIIAIINQQIGQIKWLATSLQTTADASLTNPKEIIIDTGAQLHSTQGTSNPTITIQGYLPSDGTIIDMDVSFVCNGTMMSMGNVFSNLSVVNRSTASISNVYVFSRSTSYVSNYTLSASIGIKTTASLANASFYVRAKNIKENSMALMFGNSFLYDQGWGFRYATLTNTDRIPEIGTNNCKECPITNIGISIEQSTKIDNLSRLFMGTCSTAAAVAEKAVTCPSFQQSDLVVGAIVFVTFTVTNSASASSLTMNVNNTGAKPLRYMRNNVLDRALPAANWLKENLTTRFTYDGTNWSCDIDYDMNTIYEQQVSYTTNGPDPIYRLRFGATDADGHLIPFNTTDSSSDTTNYAKPITTRPINPFGMFWNTDSTTTMSPGETNITVYTERNYDVRYSFNIQSNGTSGTTALEFVKDVYLKCLYDYDTKLATIVSDITSNNYLERSGLVQDLPNTDPNTSLSGNTTYIYIYLGVAFSKYQLSLRLDHPVYRWNPFKGACEQFTPNDELYQLPLSTPSTDGTYLLKSVVTNGVPTISWTDEIVTIVQSGNTLNIS